MKTRQNRVLLRHLPNTPHSCAERDCVYRESESGECDNPRINKGNSDAFCHKRNNKTVLEWLTGSAKPEI